MEEEMITITKKQYKELLKDSYELECLKESFSKLLTFRVPSDKIDSSKINKTFDNEFESH